MQADSLVELVLTEMVFLREQDGSEAHVSGIIISSGGTHNVSSRTDGSIVVLEKSSNRGAEWTI